MCVQLVFKEKTGQTFGVPSWFAEFALHLKVLQAEQVEWTGKELKMQMPHNITSLPAEIKPLPSVRKFVTMHVPTTTHFSSSATPLLP